MFEQLLKVIQDKIYEWNIYKDMIMLIKVQDCRGFMLQKSLYYCNERKRKILGLFRLISLHKTWIEKKQCGT